MAVSAQAVVINFTAYATYCLRSTSLQFGARAKRAAEYQPHTLLDEVEGRLAKCGEEAYDLRWRNRLQSALLLNFRSDVG